MMAKEPISVYTWIGLSAFCVMKRLKTFETARTEMKNGIDSAGTGLAETVTERRRPAGQKPGSFFLPGTGQRTRRKPRQKHSWAGSGAKRFRQDQKPRRFCIS